MASSSDPTPSTSSTDARPDGQQQTGRDSPTADGEQGKNNTNLSTSPTPDGGNGASASSTTTPSGGTSGGDNDSSTIAPDVVPPLPPAPTISELKKEGNELVKSKKFEEAVAKYTEAIALAVKSEPTDGIYLLYSNRAQALINCKKFDEAMDDAQRTIVLKPTWFKGYSHKATILLKKEQYEDIAAVAREGLRHIEKDSDGDVLRQNAALAKTALFVKSIAGSWMGRVHDIMGGYRQTLDFYPNGLLNVKIMHRMQQCQYSVKVFSAEGVSAERAEGVFVISFILPNIDSRTPYLARYVPADGDSPEKLLLCCNADVVKSTEIPDLAEFEKGSDADGFCEMTRAPAVNKDSSAELSINERVEKFAERYYILLQDPSLMEWTTYDEARLSSDPTLAAQSIKLQSHVFELEEEFGDQVVDAFFLLVCDFDDDKRKLGLPVHTSETAKAKVVAVRDILQSKGMLDMPSLQGKKQKYLEQLLKSEGLPQKPTSGAEGETSATSNLLLNDEEGQSDREKMAGGASSGNSLPFALSRTEAIAAASVVLVAGAALVWAMAKGTTKNLT
ncbi:unnamed protein product [Amoebophrya sp. A25]|nr:unnamed protein product [Amoebophrya sp. A25]|eukprot:GSA25T00010067001.1